MKPLTLNEHANADALAEAMAAALAAAIREGVARRGSAWLALAGGSTPFAAYRQLAAMDLPWQDVNLVATDERWVPVSHAKRNEAALREAFAKANGLQLHPLVPDRADGPPNTEAALHSLALLGGRPFDAVLLGMGGDAHIASLFPGVTPQDGLDPASRSAAIAVTPDPLPPEAPYARVSLCVSRLIAARTLLLMLVGTTKRDVLHAARERSPSDAPVNAVLAAAPDLAIHWSP